MEAVKGWVRARGLMCSRPWAGRQGLGPTGSKGHGLCSPTCSTFHSLTSRHFISYLLFSHGDRGSRIVGVSSPTCSESWSGWEAWKRGTRRDQRSYGSFPQIRDGMWTLVHIEVLCLFPIWSWASEVISVLELPFCKIIPSTLWK